MKKKYNLIQNSLGYFEVKPNPSVEELEEYYSQRYYQNNLSSYEKTYTDEELQYFGVEADLCVATINRYSSISKSLLDVGCGEGFFAKSLLEYGWEVKCVDFSEEGVAHHNPELLQFFKRDDLYSFVGAEAKKKNTYGLVNLDNVLEHVINPKELLTALKKVMNVNSLARIEVPNDFSKFQKLLVELGCTNETWVSAPEHLSYFNSESLVNLLKAEGFEIVSLQADFPIEQFLLNENSNYWKDRKLGKSAHMARVICTNYMAEANLHRLVDFREAAADLDFGRCLTAYVKLA